MCVFMLSLVLMQFCSPLMVLETCPSYILEMRQREMNVKRVIRWKRKKSSREMFTFLGATRSFYGRDIYLRLQIMTLLRSLYS